MTGARRLADSPWPLAACALIAYAALASPRIVDGDSAELAVLGVLGGRAHPPGYPLYVLWLRLWSWLPGATPAHTAALATAILGALAVAALHAACRAWGARPLAATIAAGVFAAAPVVQRYASEAEVFALNDLICALVLLLAASGGPLRGRWRAAALGLVAGAGLANHLTCALVAPIGVLGAVRAAREARPALGTIAIALGGLAIGLVPYAYLLVADGPAAWGSAASAADVVAIFLRSDYGGATGFAAAGADVAWWTSVAALAVTVGRTWLWLPALGGAAMLAVRIWRPGPRRSSIELDPESRWGWAMLAASLALAGPVLVARFNIEPRGLGRYVCERFHVLPALLLAVPVAALVDAIGDRVGDRLRLRPAAGLAAALAGFAALTLAGVPGMLRVHSPATELGVQNLVRSLPVSAIAIVLDDDHCAGGRYLQLVRGERPDVALVCGGLLPLAWYRARWAARGLDLPPGPGARLGQALIRTGRPVLIEPRMTGSIGGLSGYPFGVLHRVVPPGAALPAASEVAAINRELYRGFDLDYPRPGRDDGFATAANHRYARTWAAIAGLLDAAGDRAGASDARAVARALVPGDEP
jgi:hypothetical protein